MQRQRVSVFAAVYRQFHDLLHHATCNRRIVDGVDVLGLLVELAVEVHADRLSAVDGNVVDEAALVEEVECRLRHHVHLHLLGLALPAVFQLGVVSACGVRHQGDAAQGAPHVGNHRPLRILCVRAAVAVLGLYADIAVLRLECRTLCRCRNGLQLRNDVGRIAVVPHRIADVLLRHHTVPLASGYFLVILQVQQ